MKIASIYSGSDGESHFRDAEIPTAISDGDMPHSKHIRIGEVFLRAGVLETKESKWHCASRRQYVFILAGEMTIEVGDGSKRRFGPGDIFLAEDLAGHGHLSHATNKRSLVSTWMIVPDA